MRAFLLPFVFALLAALPALAQAQDPNEDLRRYVNGTWTLTFREEVKGGEGDIKSVSSVITITLRYDGTRTITQDEYLNDQAPIRSAEITDYYRVDEGDGTNFTMTTWSDTDPAKVTNRMRAGADQMKAEGSDAIYQRVAGSQETPPSPLPPQRDAPGAPAATAQPPAAPATNEAQNALDARMHAYMVGRWAATLSNNGTTIESMMEYRASGEVSGYQKVTANGQSQIYDIKGAYTAAGSSETDFTLTFYLPGQQPVSAALQIVDQNTLFNPKENYRATRVP